jgi:P4 family phage/plasmid primase-like protien
MESQIEKLLKKNRVEGIFHSHVCMHGIKGKFLFNRNSLEEFWDMYCKEIQENSNFSYGIAEKPQQYLPVLADIDLKIKDTEQKLEKDKLYSEKQLEDIIGIYQSILKKIIQDCDEKDLTCVVLEKNLYTQTKNGFSYIKNGFHLHFPKIFINKVEQEVHIIPRVQEQMKEMEIFKNIGITDYTSVVDKGSHINPWLLYGSKKSDESGVYKITKIYDCDLKKISIEKAFSGYQIYDNKDQLININKNIEYYLPRILSIIPYNRQEKRIKRGIVLPLKEKLKKERKKSSGDKRTLGAEEALILARKLLPMLSDNRASEMTDWMTVGWILYNISDGSSDALDLWCEFSSRCEEKYDETECFYKWERMTKRNLGIKTLEYYAGIDNPEEYKKFKSDNAEKYVIASLEGSHNDVAKALYAEYGDEFVCASISNKIWFQFVNHKWEEIESGIFLREKISGKIVDKYTDAVKKIHDEIAKCQDKARETMLNARINQIRKLISNLKHATFKDNVMKEAMEVFYDPNFKHRLDADPYLIAFKNGVYDLKTIFTPGDKKCPLRPGRPEDFLSKSLPINYVEFSEDHEKVQEIYSFLEKVFPDKSLRNYFKDISSDVFVGGNHEKIVVFWTGEGDNGKSVTQNFFDVMLGKLAIKMNTTILTGKKPSAGSAFADLARAGGGVRWAVLEEPDGDEAINNGTLKLLSGNDSFYARDLFEKGKDGREIVPLFKLNFICNKLPRIKNADKAVFNRVRVLPFESTFYKDPSKVPATYEEQLREKKFPMDKHFSKKIPELVEAFAWVLLQHRQQIVTRIEPDKVKIATEMYCKQNDNYRQFVDENIIEDAEKTLSLSEIYEMFKEWFRCSLPGHSLPVKNELEEYFTKLWGSPKLGKKWKGYRRRTIKDDIDDGSVVILSENDIVNYDDKK